MNTEYGKISERRQNMGVPKIKEENCGNHGLLLIQSSDR
jgi:hypothetical protein